MWWRTEAAAHTLDATGRVVRYGPSEDGQSIHQSHPWTFRTHSEASDDEKTSVNENYTRTWPATRKTKALSVHPPQTRAFARLDIDQETITPLHLMPLFFPSRLRTCTVAASLVIVCVLEKKKGRPRSHGPHNRRKSAAFPGTI
jgi:hypothetical protein